MEDFGPSGVRTRGRAGDGHDFQSPSEAQVLAMTLLYGQTPGAAWTKWETMFYGGS